MYDVEKVRVLNDVARTTLTGCRVMFTQGVAGLEYNTTMVQHKFWGQQIYYSRSILRKRPTYM